MFINMVVNMERSIEEYERTNLAKYYLMLYAHKLQTATSSAADEPTESESVGDFFAQMREHGITQETTIKP